MLGVIDIFDTVKVINLQYRADRRREIESQLERINLDWLSTGIEIFRAVQPDDAGDFPSIGARGCFLSHLTILQEAVEKSSSAILIIEDDLDFCKDIQTRLDETITSLSEVEWSIFYGGHENIDCHDTHPICHQLAYVDAELPIQTTHMVAFRGEAIRQAKEYLEAMIARPPGSPEGGPMHVDGAYSWFRQAHPALKTIAAFPPLGFQRSSKSDIHALNWYDRAPVVAWTVAYARAVKNWLAR